MSPIFNWIVFVSTIANIWMLSVVLKIPDGNTGLLIILLIGSISGTISTVINIIQWLVDRNQFQSFGR